MPFADESFDAVIFAHVLEHLAEPVETLREMVRVLKPGAPLIGSVTRKGPGQVLLSLRWQNRGYASHQLDAFLQAAGLDAVQSFDYGAGWSQWMCIAAIGVKPRSTIAVSSHLIVEEYDRPNATPVILSVWEDHYTEYVYLITHIGVLG